jgi:hypothetical protein
MATLRNLQRGASAGGVVRWRTMFEEIVKTNLGSLCIEGLHAAFHYLGDRLIECTCYLLCSQDESSLKNPVIPIIIIITAEMNGIAEG